MINTMIDALKFTQHIVMTGTIALMLLLGAIAIVNFLYLK